MANPPSLLVPPALGRTGAADGALPGGLGERLTPRTGEPVTPVPTRLAVGTSRLIDELVAVAQEELAAEASGRDEERAADLQVRAALLAWDGRGDAGPLGELGRSARAAEHPVARRLRRDLALESDDDGLLAALAEEARARGDWGEVRALAEWGLLRGGRG